MAKNTNSGKNMSLPCITIRQLREGGLQFAFCYEDSLLVTNRVESIERFRLPCRIDAVTVLVCISGEAECTINLNRYHISRDMVVIALPDDIIQIESSCRLEAYAVLMSSALFGDIGLDSNSRSDFYLRIRHNAACCLPQEQVQTLKPYYALLCENIQNVADETPEIIRGLLRAFTYSVIARMRMCQPQTDGGDTAAGNHGKQLFGEFMSLVKRHHTSCRGVRFYADKLCLTPNYLSGVVKEYTGKTATEWVNDFVVVEAKIMLKDTSFSVQEISDRLNFPDQSTFGKYFKKIVGVSPKVYRDSK